YTTLLSATFLSLPVFYISARYLPEVLINHFHGLRYLYSLPIPLLIVINLPIGYALQSLLTRYGKKGAWVALANVVLTGAGRIYSGLDTDKTGTGVILGTWIVSLLVSIFAIYIFVFRP